VAELLLTLMAGEQKALMGGVISIFQFSVFCFPVTESSGVGEQCGVPQMLWRHRTEPMGGPCRLEALLHFVSHFAFFLNNISRVILVD
jgi:hypothetical protein